MFKVVEMVLNNINDYFTQYFTITYINTTFYLKKPVYLN